MGESITAQLQNIKSASHPKDEKRFLLLPHGVLLIRIPNASRDLYLCRLEGVDLGVCGPRFNMNVFYTITNKCGLRINYNNHIFVYKEITKNHLLRQPM